MPSLDSHYSATTRLSPVSAYLTLVLPKLPDLGRDALASLALRLPDSIEFDFNLITATLPDRAT